MNIYEALANIDYQFAVYFKYKHPELRSDRDRTLNTEKDFLHHVGRSTMLAFQRWEKTSEYKALLSIYLNYKISEDYSDIYQKVAEIAKKGDEKAVKLFLTLKEDISKTAKVASTELVKDKKSNKNDDDELLLD